MRIFDEDIAVGLVDINVEDKLFDEDKIGDGEMFDNESSEDESEVIVCGGDRVGCVFEKNE